MASTAFSVQPLALAMALALLPIAVDTVIAVKGIFDWVDLIWVSPAGMKGCWRRRRGSSPRAAARPFGLRGLVGIEIERAPL
jgi:hypothetical protein